MNCKPLVAIICMAVFGVAQTQASQPELALQHGDVRLVQVELAPGEMPKLVIYFTKRKLMEAQGLIGQHFDEKLKITANGKLVTEARVQSQLLYKRNMITLGFPTAEAALDAAKLLVFNK